MKELILLKFLKNEIINLITFSFRIDMKYFTIIKLDLEFKKLTGVLLMFINEIRS